MKTQPKAPAAIDQKLSALEQKWFEILKAEFTNKSLPTAASSEVQFFSTDFPRTYVAGKDESELLRVELSTAALCVVCVGITHNAYRDRHEENQIIPHIYTRSNSQSWTVDLSRTRATRRALVTALAAFVTNRKRCVDNSYASGDGILPNEWDEREADFPVILIKTYLSPFLATKPWSENSGSARSELLSVWNPNRHICDLIQVLRNNVDLWVVQSPVVWRHFDKTSPFVRKWLLTPTLSYESQRNGALMNFWRTKRAEEKSVPPLFPWCEQLS